ncbi:hypothetical protein D031_2807B, partial [Vibrio parahaemolyticus VP-48]
YGTNGNSKSSISI